MERHPFEHGLFRLPVRELQVTRLNLPGKGPRHHPRGAALLLALRQGIQQELRPAVQGGGLSQLQQGSCQGQQRCGSRSKGGGEAHKRTDAQTQTTTGNHQRKAHKEQRLSATGDGLGCNGEPLFLLAELFRAGVGLQVLADSAIFHSCNADLGNTADQLIQHGTALAVPFRNLGLVLQLADTQHSDHRQKRYQHSHSHPSQRAGELGHADKVKQRKYCGKQTTAVQIRELLQQDRNADGTLGQVCRIIPFQKVFRQSEKPVIHRVLHCVPQRGGRAKRCEILH